MSHWAEIDENNVVLRVVVGSNDDPDEGHQWLIDNLGGNWVKTSYNTHMGVHSEGGVPLRFNYAAEGYTYDPSRDAFIPPKPYPSWILNESTCWWEPPVPRPVEPADGWLWSEAELGWVRNPDWEVL